MIEKLEDLPGPSEIADVYYLQRYIHRDGPPFHDFRVLVCDGAAVAMMRRRNGEWITNVNRGGVPELVDPEREAPLAAMAIAAAKAVGGPSYPTAARNRRARAKLTISDRMVVSLV